MKRIIISGGGTGGHIYPAITIYKEIMKQNMNHGSDFFPCCSGDSE